MKLEEARNIALEVYYQLKPHCERIKIAGSIRRKRPVVGDIEIVCQPSVTYVQAGQVGLFSDAPTVPQVSETFIGIVNQWHKIKGEPFGRYTQRWHPNEIKLDIFMPAPHDFFRILAMRTGSADFSHKVLASSWTQKGWVGTRDGLRRQDECDFKGNKWVCLKSNPKLPPVWESEKHFFEWLGLPYLLPEEREIVKTNK